MPFIISNTELQKNPSRLAHQLEKRGAIVTLHGKPHMLMLPFFDESDEWTENYLEEFAIWKNKKNLQKELLASKKSGVSDFSL